MFEILYQDKRMRKELGTNAGIDEGMMGRSKLTINSRRISATRRKICGVRDLSSGLPNQAVASVLISVAAVGWSQAPAGKGRERCIARAMRGWIPRAACEPELKVGWAGRSPILVLIKNGYLNAWTPSATQQRKFAVSGIRARVATATTSNSTSELTPPFMNLSVRPCEPGCCYRVEIDC